MATTERVRSPAARSIRGCPGVLEPSGLHARTTGRALACAGLLSPPPPVFGSRPCCRTSRPSGIFCRVPASRVTRAFASRRTFGLPAGGFWLLRMKLERLRASRCCSWPRGVGRGRGRRRVAAVVGFSWLASCKCRPRHVPDGEAEALGGQATCLLSFGRSRGPFLLLRAGKCRLHLLH